MPTSAIAHGTVILALLHSLSASTKLSVVSQSGSPAVNATRRFLPANASLAAKMHARRRSKLFTDSSRERQLPDYGYSWQQHTLWPDYSYHQSLPELTTVMATPPQPLRPRVTKLYVKPRRTVNFLDLDEADDHGWYSGSSHYRWPSAPSLQLAPAYHLRPAVERSSVDHYHGSSGHHGPSVVYHHHEDGHKSDQLDLKYIGILALVKLGLTKLKMFGILKLLFLILLKFKLLLLLFFIKFVLFLKAIKHLKALLLTFFLLLGLLLLPLLLLPALLLPLFLLRYLLPLLLLLPVPSPARIRENKTDNRLMQYLKSQRGDPIMDIMAQLMDAETCVERIACQLATRKESRLLFPIAKWYLNKLKKLLKYDRASSFVDAYVKSSEAYENSEDWESIDGGQWCQQRYSCVDSNSSNENDDHNNSDSSDSSSETTTQTESVSYIMINRVTKK